MTSSVVRPFRPLARLRAYAFSPPAPEVVWRWLALLIAVDLALVALHVGWRGVQVFGMVGPIPPTLSTFGDVGLAERFNHGKWIVLVALLALTWWRTRVPAFLALAGVFIVVLLDDSLQLHERGSFWLLGIWPDMTVLGLSSAETGELIVWATLGMILLPMTLWGVLATPRAWWPVLGYIGLGFAGLVFFAVVWDATQEIILLIGNPSLRYWAMFAANIVESAGESLFASLTLAYAAGIHRRYGQPALSPGLHPAE